MGLEGMGLDYYLSYGLLFPRQRPSAGTPSSARRLAGAVFIAALALSLQGREILGSFRGTRPKLRYTPCARLLPRWGALASNPLRPSHTPGSSQVAELLSAKADSAAPCATDKRVHGISDLRVADAP